MIFLFLLSLYARTAFTVEGPYLRCFRSSSDTSRLSRRNSAVWILPTCLPTAPGGMWALSRTRQASKTGSPLKMRDFKPMIVVLLLVQSSSKESRFSRDGLYPVWVMVGEATEFPRPTNFPRPTSGGRACP